MIYWIKDMPVVITQSAEETKKLGEILGQELLFSQQFRKKSIVIGLEGELGSGKTVFIQGLVRGLGIKNRITSPTFVIMRKYRLQNSKWPNHLRPTKIQNSFFYHIDCYRLHRAKELLDLGFKELLLQPENIIAIEWAERVRRILPKNSLWIKFKHLKLNRRKIIC